jgi:PAS domain S-box-containing protein
VTIHDRQGLIPLHERVHLIRLQAFFRNAAGATFAFCAGGVLAAYCLHRIGVSGGLLQACRTAWQVSQSAVGEIATRERLHDEMADRKLNVEALRASKDQSNRLASMLRLMCDNVPDMIWAKDLEGRYTFVNKSFCQVLLGVEDTLEPLGKTFDFFVQRERERHPDDAQWQTLGEFSRDVDQHVLGRDEPTIYEESGNVRGQLVFLNVHQARFLDARGEVIGTVGCARHHRSQDDRSLRAASGAPRRVDRPAQPVAADRPPAPGSGAGPARAGKAGRVVTRPRSAQAGQ